MVELIAAIILIASIGGMVFIVCRKMPAVSEFQEIGPGFHFDWKGIFFRAKDATPLKNFSFEAFLQKVLSRVRVLTLKTDHKTSSWLQKLREKAKKKKEGDDNYWQEVKESPEDKE